MAILNQTKGFTRNYDINGNIGVSKRGTAVRQMVSFAKEGEKVAKSYRKYKKKFGKNVVSYVYFAIMLKSFGKVMALSQTQKVLFELDNNPRATMGSAINWAFRMSEMIDASEKFFKKVA